METLYDISEVSRIFGLSASGLRFYEEKKLIQPQYTESGRRKYSDEDLEKLFMLRTMRGLELSMDDTHEHFRYNTEFTCEETGEFMLQRAEDMQRKAAYFEELANHLQIWGKHLKELEEQVGKIDEVVAPLYYNLSLEPLFGKEKKMQQGIAEWISMGPITHVLSVLTVENGCVIERKKGLGISKEYADRVSLVLRECAQEIPGIRSMYVVYCTQWEDLSLHDEDVEKILGMLEQTYTDRKLRFVVRRIYSCQVNGQRRNYFYVWINPY